MLVGAAGVGVLVGCSPGGEGADAAGSGPSAVERARARVARDSEALLERYDAVIAAHPDLAALLTPLRGEVVRHARAFGGGKAAGAGRASASPSGSPSASASPSPAPEDPRAALTELAAAERRLADKRAEALLEVPGEMARLMASVAAAGASHAYVLTEGAK
ncbi:hypothetical protein OG622_14980 [Streptomyces sp. NBC_01314]|nr:hypothetical protein OG622_14980 [Streptomyces sp. NBC_01314]